MATVDFDNERLVKLVRAALIIESQNAVINEEIGALANEFGVTKGMAKKIIQAYAKDTLEKTQEKLEDERTSMSNATMLIEAVENMSIDKDEVLAELEDSEDE